MKYLRRGLFFVLVRLLVITAVFGAGVVSFYYAMNLTNLQIILKDGMARRAQVIMGAESESELNKYFQSSFLANDAALVAYRNGESPYRDYTVRGIDHRIHMGFVWVWPWDERCHLTIREEIPRIDGRVKGDRAEEIVQERGQNAVYPPAWQSSSYEVTLVREQGRWLIRSMQETR